jgi:DNA-binding response OmpR family regulator
VTREPTVPEHAALAQPDPELDLPWSSRRHQVNSSDRVVGTHTFHLPELVLRIRALARHKPTAQPRILRAAGIELDPLRRTVTRHGRQVDISSKEFAVLETLLKAAPATLSAEDLLAQAWDENTDPFTKTVQVTISRLRRKLGDPPPIQTIPGIGYRITHPSHQPGP